MPRRYYSVQVDEPNAHEFLEHVVRAAYNDAYLHFNLRPFDADDVKKLTRLVSHVLPELYQQAVELEDSIARGEIERRCGEVGDMNNQEVKPNA